jgi:hypothetical protein
MNDKTHIAFTYIDETTGLDIRKEYEGAAAELFLELMEEGVPVSEILEQLDGEEIQTEEIQQETSEDTDDEYSGLTEEDFDELDTDTEGSTDEEVEHDMAFLKKSEPLTRDAMVDKLTEFQGEAYGWIIGVSRALEIESWSSSVLVPLYNRQQTMFGLRFLVTNKFPDVCMVVTKEEFETISKLLSISDATPVQKPEPVLLKGTYSESKDRIKPFTKEQLQAIEDQYYTGFGWTGGKPAVTEGTAKEELRARLEEQAEREAIAELKDSCLNEIPKRIRDLLSMIGLYYDLEAKGIIKNPPKDPLAEVQERLEENRGIEKHQQFLEEYLGTPTDTSKTSNGVDWPAVQKSVEAKLKRSCEVTPKEVEKCSCSNLLDNYQIYGVGTAKGELSGKPATTICIDEAAGFDYDEVDRKITLVTLKAKLKEAENNYSAKLEEIRSFYKLREQLQKTLDGLPDILKALEEERFGIAAEIGALTAKLLNAEQI